MSRILKSILGATLLALITASCGGGEHIEAGGGGEPGATAAIAVVEFAYDPAALEVAPGTTVTWTNEDDILHTVTSGEGPEQGVPGVSEDDAARPDGLFEGPLEDRGAAFSFTFTEVGTFVYHCAIHVGMKGEVVVR